MVHQLTPERSIPPYRLPIHARLLSFPDMQRVIDKTGRFLDPQDHFRDSTAFVADPGQGGFVRLRNLCRDDDGRSFSADLVEKVQRCPAGSSPSNQNT